MFQLTTASSIRHACFAALVLTACGHAPAATPDTAAAPDLAGHWVSACEHGPDGQGGQLNFVRDFTITPATWAIEFSLYGDPACAETARLFTVHVAGAYQVGGPSAVAGAHEAFFGIAARTITPASDQAAQFLTGGAMCGRADWQAGVAIDVQASGCPGLGLQPAATCAGEYDLVRRDGDTLALGARPADGNLCEPARRPTALGAPLARH